MQENNNEIKNWLAKANGDMANAKAVINKKVPAWIVCFHSQQTAEKALKAAQIYFLHDYKKEHNLEILLLTLKEKINIEPIREDCYKLSDYYVITRYPDSKEFELTHEDAIFALKMAEKILDYIQSLIN